MAATFPRYSRLLNAAARRKGVHLQYSSPEVVSGGSCPPPSRIYPGQSCYMITVSINPNQCQGNGKVVECHGFGPNPTIARCAAESKAYKALTSSACDAQNFTESVEHEGDKSERVETVTPSVAPPQSKDPVSSGLGHSSAASDDYRRHGLQQSQLVRPLDGHFCSGDTEAQSSTATPTGRGSADISQTCISETGRYGHLAFDGGSVRNEKNAVYELQQFTKRHGIEVMFDVRRVTGTSGECEFVAVCRGRGLQFSCHHSDAKVAKAMAAQILLEALQNSPQRKLGDPYKEVFYHDPPFQDEEAVLPQKAPRPSSRGTDTPTSELEKGPFQPGYRNDPVTFRGGRQSPSPAGAVTLSDNPIGQLYVLIEKELHAHPVFAESIQTSGTFKKYTCVVSAKGLSAEGVGCSKKLAKRHAAENLLELMTQHGMNVDPIQVEGRPKKFCRLKRSSSFSRYTRQTDRLPPFRHGMPAVDDMSLRLHCVTPPPPCRVRLPCPVRLPAPRPPPIRQPLLQPNMPSAPPPMPYGPPIPPWPMRPPRPPRPITHGPLRGPCLLPPPSGPSHHCLPPYQHNGPTKGGPPQSYDCSTPSVAVLKRQLFPATPSCVSESDDEGDGNTHRSPGLCEILPKELPTRAPHHGIASADSTPASEDFNFPKPPQGRSPFGKQNEHLQVYLTDEPHPQPRNEGPMADLRTLSYQRSPPSDPLFFTVRLPKEREMSSCSRGPKTVSAPPPRWDHRPAAACPQTSPSASYKAQVVLHRPDSGSPPELPVHPLLQDVLTHRPASVCGHACVNELGALLRGFELAKPDMSVSLPSEGSIL